MAISVTTPLDLLEVVPVVLGYQPTECLVGLVLNQHTGRVQYAMRLDIDAAINHPEQAADPLKREDGVVALAAFAAIQETGREAVIRIMAQGVAPVAPPPLASLNGWTWIDPDHPNTIQWTRPWTEAETQAARAAFRAEATAASGVSWPEHTEADLAERYGTTPDQSPRWETELAAASADAEATGDPDETRAERISRYGDELAAWIPERLGETISSTEAAATVARLSYDPQVRDAAAVMITPDTAADHLDLWNQVAGHAGPHHEALNPLFLAALAGLITGGTTTARLIRERAELLPGADQFTGFAMIQRLSWVNMAKGWPQARRTMYRSIFGHDPTDE
jgi:hypothetical protein